MMLLHHRNDIGSDHLRWQVTFAVLAQCVSLLILCIGGIMMLLLSFNDNDNDQHHWDYDDNNNSVPITNHSTLEDTRSMLFPNVDQPITYEEVNTITGRRMIEDTSQLLSSVSSSSSPSSTVDLLLQLFQQLMSATFISYAIGTGLLLVPILYDATTTTTGPSVSISIRKMASYCHYCSTISTSILGLCLVIVSMIVYSQARDNSNDDDDDDYNNNSNHTIVNATFVQHNSIDGRSSGIHSYLSSICYLLLSMGFGILLSSSTSLMIRFWPTPTTSQHERRESIRTNTNQNTVSSVTDPVGRNHVDDDEEEDALGLLRTPLIHPDDHAEEGDCDDTTTTMLENGTHSSSQNVNVATTTSSSSYTNESDMDGTSQGQEPSSGTSPTITTTARTTITGGSTSHGSATRRLLQLASSQTMYLYIGCIVLLIRLPFSLAIPHFVSTTLAAVSGANYALARDEITLLFISGSVDALLDFWAFFLFGYANQRIVRKLRIDLFTRLLRQEVAFFDAHSSGELSSRLNSDCSEMASDLTWFFRFSIESMVRITGISIYMMVRCPILGSCAISIIPAVAIINKSYGDWLQHNAIKVQNALADANMVAQEALSNIRTVISFVTESHECERYENRIERQYQLNIQQLFMMALYYMVVSTFLINTVVQGTFLWVGSILIERDELTPEVLLAFMLYQSQLENEVLSLMNSYTSLIKSSGAGDKVFALIDRQPPPPSTANRTTEQYRSNEDVGPSTTEGNDHSNERDGLVENMDLNDNSSILSQCSDKEHVVFDNVSFAYPSRPENIIINHLNLIIPRGQTVALVGTSGGGKTTIMNLIQRFYDPCSGRVLIYGKDLRTIDVMAHRKQIGIVTQDPILFQGTIRDNITYGCLVPEQVREEHIIDAAQLSHAHDFIQSFPDGYDTMIGERGVQLSGGQKQRIAIARALIVQPTLLLLDEATSSLDTESEIAVQRALDELLSTDQNQNHRQGTRTITTVVIAHRLRTVQNAHQIVVLQHGRVVEIGTHHGLLTAPTGIYRQMVELSGSSGLLPG